MKAAVKLILQKLLGLKNYLFVFSVFVIIKLRWDKKEKDFMHFLSLIPDGGIILDIGANIGVTSWYLSKRFPRSRILSFEPVKINLDTLKSVARLFSLKNVLPMKMALGNENGTVKMVMPVIGKVKFHGLAHVVHDELKENNSGITCTVPIARLDDLAEITGAGAKVNAIKMDVENFEYFVLLGGQEMIKRDLPVLYCELWKNENRKRCIRFLETLGYHTYTLQDKKLVVCNDLNIDKNNFFFLPGNLKN